MIGLPSRASTEHESRRQAAAQNRDHQRTVVARPQRYSSDEPRSNEDDQADGLGRLAERSDSDAREQRNGSKQSRSGHATGMLSVESLRMS